MASLIPNLISFQHITLSWAPRPGARANMWAGGPSHKKHSTTEMQRCKVVRDIGWGLRLCFSLGTVLKTQSARSVRARMHACVYYAWGMCVPQHVRGGQKKMCQPLLL